MSALALFLILLKASLTSFSGLAAIPIVREELVIQHHVLTDTQLNQLSSSPAVRLDLSQFIW